MLEKHSLLELINGKKKSMNKSTKINIIPFQDKHEKGVIELIVNIQQNEFGLPITALDQPDLADIKKKYQKQKGNFWVAESENQILGTISLLDIGNHMAALRKMFVHSSYRGLKTGSGVEPVRKWLKSLSLEYKKTIGEDIKTVQFG